MRRYILAPDAVLDLVEIWRHLKSKASAEIAERVEKVIREKIVFLAITPGAGLARGFDRRIRQVLCRLFISDRLPA